MQNPPYLPPFLHENDDPDYSDLVNVPKAYRHSRCGKVTPNNLTITRNIHREPLKLMGDGNIAGCIHCPDGMKRQHPASEFTWVETNESVLQYLHSLQAEYHLKHPWGWFKPAILSGLAYAGIILLLGLLVLIIVGLKLKISGETAGWIVMVTLGLALFTLPARFLYKLAVRQKRIRDYRRRFPQDNPDYPTRDDLLG
jgi:hypothetical protein